MEATAALLKALGVGSKDSQNFSAVTVNRIDFY